MRSGFFFFLLIFFTGLVAFPKILIINIPVLISDILLLLFSLFVIFYRKKIWNSILFYIFLVFISVAFSSLMSFVFDTFSLSDAFLGIKRFMYIFGGLYFAHMFKIYCGSDKFIPLLKRFMFIGLVPLLFSLFEILGFLFFDWKVDQIFLVDYDQSSYNTSFLPVGFTGRATDFNNLYLIGSSSINYGLFNALFGSLALILWLRKEGLFYLFVASLYITTSILSRSSSVMVLMIVMVIYFALRFVKIRNILILMAPVLLTFFSYKEFYIIVDLLDTLNSIGGNSSGDFDSWNLRVLTFVNSLEAILNNPIFLLWGSGYGSTMALAMSSESALIESFVFESMLGVGLVSTLCVLFLIFGVNLIVQKQRNIIHVDIQKLFLFIFPVVLLLNTLSGNIFGNEFLGFTTFFITGYFTKFI